MRPNTAAVLERRNRSSKHRNRETCRTLLAAEVCQTLPNVLHQYRNSSCIELHFFNCHPVNQQHKGVYVEPDRSRLHRAHNVTADVHRISLLQEALPSRMARAEPHGHGALWTLAAWI
jgi:hypothetical protein